MVPVLVWMDRGCVASLLKRRPGETQSTRVDGGRGLNPHGSDFH